MVRDSLLAPRSQIPPYDTGSVALSMMQSLRQRWRDNVGRETGVIPMHLTLIRNPNMALAGIIDLRSSRVAQGQHHEARSARSCAAKVRVSVSCANPGYQSWNAVHSSGMSYAHTPVPVGPDAVDRHEGSPAHHKFGRELDIVCGSHGCGPARGMTSWWGCTTRVVRLALCSQWTVESIRLR